MIRRAIGLLVTLALAMLVAPLTVEAQPPAKILRLGVLAPGPSGEQRALNAFR